METNNSVLIYNSKYHPPPQSAIITCHLRWWGGIYYNSKYLPTTADGKQRELKHARKTLASNGYPKTLISKITKTQTDKNTPSPEDLVRTFFQQVDPSEPYIGYATLPYIKGITETLSRTLRKHNIKVHNKPLRTLQREFP